MTSKDIILNKIRTSNRVKTVALPEITDFGITFDDKIEKFKEIIQTVGGVALECKKEDLDKTIQELYPSSQIITSNVKSCTLGNFEPNDKEDAHELNDIDLAVVKGEFAVAENGAVWIKNESNLHRVLYFIVQNIVIVVEKDKIVNNMHEAYEKIDFKNAGYGAFISGPSKTADIEQSLVIGAHGPKSGYVIFI